MIGRQADATVCLESQAVSRHHARVLCDSGNYFVEDLNSSNGTYLNGKAIKGRVLLQAGDEVHLGEYVLSVRPSEMPSLPESDLFIREKVNAVSSKLNGLVPNPAFSLGDFQFKDAWLA